MPVQKLIFLLKHQESSSVFELESLILEIWTNGSIKPDEALSTSAEILENTFGLLKVTRYTSNIYNVLKHLFKKKNLNI